MPSLSTPPAASTATRIGLSLLLLLAALLLVTVIVTPIALSSQDLIDWAAAPTGLNLPRPWPLLVFLALDAAAAVCVLLTVYCAWRGEPAGVFGALVWCFALGSAFANWRHGTTPGAAPDAVWFFPAMSLAGPVLLEAILGRFRRWTQRDHGRRGKPTPSYGWRRWTPGLGALRDTYGAYRTALLCGIDTVDESITAYHQLCPGGSLHVASALRAHHTRRPSGNTDGGHADVAVSNGTELPVDLMRRIPVQTEAYQRWRVIWNDLRTGQGDSAGLAALADRHGLSVRQLEFIRRAGQARLLDTPVPPAVRLAHLASAPSRAEPAVGPPQTRPPAP